MKWKELFSGVVATALLLLAALWTTDFEIGSRSGLVIANVIICLVSVAWRIVLNPFVCKDNISLDMIKTYALGAFIASVVTVIVGL